jgi:hypothetical protein
MSPNRSRAALVAIAMGAMALTGCQPAPAPMTQSQTLVVDTADQVAAGDTTGALASLDVLEAEVAAQLASGELDQAAADRIRAAVAVVRADLAALTTPATETPDTTESTTPEDSGVQPAAPVEPTVIESDDAEEGDEAEESDSGNDGNGNGNSGNGNTGNGNTGNTGNGQDKEKPEKPEKGKNED